MTSPNVQPSMNCIVQQCMLREVPTAYTCTHVLMCQGCWPGLRCAKW